MTSRFLRSFNNSQYSVITKLHGTNKRLSYPTQQQRSIVNIFKNFQGINKAAQLKQMMENNPDERTVLEYLRALNAISPLEVSAYIERGWTGGKFPVNEEFLREYLKAVASMKKLDSLNITGLLALLNKSLASGGVTDPKVLGAANSAAFNINVSDVLRPTSRPFNAGSSPFEPLYIQQQDLSWKAQLWKLARGAIGIFLAFALLGTLIDEKAGGSNGISSRLGLSSAVHQSEKSDKSFDDVVGIDEAKHELQEIVLYLKDPKRFTRLGGRLPKGILLTGPPGTGKTLLARAIAGEAKVPFYHASGSEFEEMYVGVGAKRVRELFEVAKTKAPCIIFIDEIDAIGGSRQVKDQSAMKMTLNQLLVEMDGFEQNNGVIVIAATNFPDSLDNALIRPGRFDKHVDVALPDIGGRKAILNFYCKKIPLDADVDLEQLARGTPGFSGAELFNLVNQAALKASVDGLKAVGMGALEFAKDKLMMGSERKSAIISPATMRMTAFHEAGHALVALKTDGSDPIHKATIMPRGRALGMVMQLPDGDQTSMSRKQMLARLDVCMGGRVAEEIIYGAENVTSGASSDIQQATRLARAMVTKYGLSDKVGIMFIDEKLPLSIAAQEDVDREVRSLLVNSYNRAKQVLTTNVKELDIIANGLLEYESLSGSELVDLCKGRTLHATKRSQKPSRDMQSIAVMSQKEKSTGNTGGTGGAAAASGSGSGEAIPATASVATAVSASTSAATTTGNARVNAPATVTKKPSATASTASTAATHSTNAAAAATTSSNTVDKLLPPSAISTDPHHPVDHSKTTNSSTSNSTTPPATTTRGPPKI